MMRTPPRHVVPIILYAILAILVIPIFAHYVSPNEFSRWDLAVAIVDFHTIEVTRAVAATNTETEDLAEIDGRKYSNKAPGAALVGLPGYAVARWIVGPPSPRNMRVTLTAMRWLGSTLPAILLALCVAATAIRFGASEDRATFVVVAMLFGTPLFAYGLLFFAHALSALALFGAFVLLFDTRLPALGSRLSGPPDSRRPTADSLADSLAGAMIGLAVLTEYPSVIPAAILIACALPRLRFPGALRVVAGGLPFAIALAIYNHFAFGRVFTLSSAHESQAFYREVAQHGLFGVGLPSPIIFLHLLADPAKGLFVFSPVLLLAFTGLRRAYETVPRSTFIALVATPLSILVTFAGYPNWHGGWTVGARYLVPALPFFALLIAFAAPTIVDWLLLGASVTVVAIVSLVFPFVGSGYAAPWITFSWPILRDGYVAPNLLHFVSRPLAIAVPFALVLAASLAAVPRRRFAWFAAGAAIWFAGGFLFAGAGSKNVRAVVEAVQFGDATAIRRAAPDDPRVRSALEAIARDQRRRPPDYWPF
jgi:hypothetical protein